jgi:hypothetical protein
VKKLILLPSLLFCQLGFAEELIIGRNSAPLPYLYELSKEEKGSSLSREKKVSLYFAERCTNLNLHLQFSKNTDNKDYYKFRNRIFLPALAAEKGFYSMNNEFLTYLESLDPILINYDENPLLVQMDYEFCDRLYLRLKNIFEEEDIPY